MPEILYADAAVVVCVKPVGALSEGDGENAMPALLRAALGGEFYPVHRLDQPAGGVMVYARTKPAAARLSAAVQTEAFGKEYLAVLDGCPEAQEDALCDLLFFDRQKKKSYVVKRARAGVKQARLSYRVLETAEERALVRVKLDTGRTHQIRVQFSSRGWPLTGDGKYGSRENRCPLALWSAELRFPHPVHGGELRFAARPPEAYPWTLFSADALGSL